jgi:hypothetical protein
MDDIQEQLLNPATSLTPVDLVRTISGLGSTPDSTVMTKADFVDNLFADAVSFSLVANTDNLTVSGLSASHVLRLSSAGPVNVTGIQTGKAGRILIIHNVGSATITLVDESSLSDPLNRLALTANIAMAPDTMVILQYDITSTRWRAAGGGGGGGSSGHTIQEEGTSLAARSKLNFIGPYITASDNLANDATDVTVSVPAPVINESTLILSDTTADNVSTAMHGFAPKLPNVSSKSLRGDGQWLSTPNPDGWAQFVDSSFAQLSTTAIQISGDYTSTFCRGTRVVWNDSGGWKYGIVLSVVFSSPNTQVTLFTTPDYPVAAGVGSMYYSQYPYPNGFPNSFAYTPALTNITIGNGSYSGRFFVIGSQVFGNWTVTRGSTTTFGAQVYVGYPCAVNEASYFVVGNVSLVDQATALYTGIQLAEGSVRCMNAAGTYAVYAYVSSTAPFTWAANDSMECAFRFKY